MHESTHHRLGWRPWIAPALAGLLGLLLTSAVTAQEMGPVMVANNATLGPILTDTAGMTLYTHAPADAPGVSNCEGACAGAWPPFVVADMASMPEDAMAAATMMGFGTITRADGTIQLTLNTWPLYYFVRDTAPGQTAGVGVNAFGGLWSVAMAPDMMMMGTTVMSGDSTLGPILTDGAGMTLYTWDRDDPAATTIATTASATWPLFIVTGPPTAPALPGILSSAPRLDGSMQVTYNGWPLYYNINDKAPGQTVGDGVGGIWHAVMLSGDM